MKRKPKVVATAPETVEEYHPVVEDERLKPAVRCSVCGSDAKPDATEQLCWVCRRLKISAWRDVEQQVPVQE
jgi:hypothetical protein